jgi:agmatine/peptidylarginine deiminase
VFTEVAKHAKVLLAIDTLSQFEEFVKQARARGLAQLVEAVDLLTAETNSIWIRDYAPFMVRDPNNRLLAIDTIYCPTRTGAFKSLRDCLESGGAGNRDDRSKDDLFPYVMAQDSGTEWVRAPLVIEGGNLQVDGAGTCYTSRKTLEHNGESEITLNDRLGRYLGCKDVVYLDPIPGDALGHIDMFFRVASDNVFLLADYRPISHPITARSYMQERVREALDRTARSLHEIRPNATIYRVPMPDLVMDSRGNAYFASHMNFLRAGNAILVPAYSWSLEQLAAAAKTLRLAYPDSELVPIPADDLLHSSGAIHCITANLPRDLLSHTHATAEHGSADHPGETGEPRADSVARVSLPLKDAPAIGGRDPLVTIALRGRPSREMALLAGQLALSVVRWPEDVRLAILTEVPETTLSGSNTEHDFVSLDALKGAQKQNLFWAAWDALWRPWPAESVEDDDDDDDDDDDASHARTGANAAPRKSGGDATELPQSASEIFTALYDRGVDVIPIERSLSDRTSRRLGIAGGKPTVKVPERPSQSWRVFANGLELTEGLRGSGSDRAARLTVVRQVVEHELAVARAMERHGTPRSQVVSKLAVLSKSAATEKQGNGHNSLMPHLGEPEGSIRLDFYLDYESPLSRQMARRISNMTSRHRGETSVRVHCVSHEYHPLSQQLCRAAYAAAESERMISSLAAKLNLAQATFVKRLAREDLDGISRFDQTMLNLYHRDAPLIVMSEAVYSEDSIDNLDTAVQTEIERRHQLLNKIEGRWTLDPARLGQVPRFHDLNANECAKLAANNTVNLSLVQGMFSLVLNQEIPRHFGYRVKSIAGNEITIASRSSATEESGKKDDEFVVRVEKDGIYVRLGEDFIPVKSVLPGDW